MICCSHPATVLWPGQAPAHEEHAREEAASWRGDFDRAVDWLEGFCQASPALQDQPLLGSCLPGLTAQLGRSQRPQTEKSKSRRRSYVQTQPEVKGRPSCPAAEPAPHYAPGCADQNWTLSAAKRREPVCPTQPIRAAKRQADPVLLSRLCPENNRSLPEAVSLPRTTRSLPSCPDRQPIPSQPVLLDDWFRNLLQRAHRWQVGANSRVSQQILPEVSPRKLHDHPESRSFAGPAVPEHLLLELSGEVSPANRKSNTREPADTQLSRHERGDGTPVHAAPDSRKLPNTSTPDNRVPADGFDAVGRQMPSAPASVPTLPEIAAVSNSTAATDAAVPLAINASSQHSFPNFHFPLASTPPGTLRHSSRVEGATGAEEDLGVLAEKIKRILNEEARRFGIDV